MITRKLGAILRGQATPFQLVSACVLGSLLGFAPGFMQGPALVLLLVGLLLVLNASLGLTLFMAGIAKVLALIIVPVSFQIGRFLLDGPTSGLAGTIVNAPVLAWFGLEYYAVAGGLLVGLVLGLVVGLLMARTIGAFRRKMVAAGADPSRLVELGAKPWARFLIWLVLGGKGKLSWEEKAGRRVGNPIRVWGAVVVLVVAGGAWFGARVLAGPLGQRWLVGGLERANGATVDVESLDLALADGRFAVTGLALADPNALDSDLFRATSLEADLDQTDLLRRRIHVSRITVRNAETGAQRTTPGERTRPPADADEEPEVPLGPEDFSLEDVLADVELWRGRLGQARRWLDRLAGEPSAETETEESYADRLAREVAAEGWFNVAAGHLVTGSPSFRVSELVVDGLKVANLEGRVLDLRIEELSSHPGLVDAPPRAELSSRDGSLAALVDLAPVSRTGGNGALSFSWKGLSVDETMARLRLPGGDGRPAPLAGGTLDLDLDGSWLDGRIGIIDLPLRVTLHDTVLQLAGMQPTHLDALELSIGLRGPIDAPRIRFERSTLIDALKDAGKRELAGRLSEEYADEIGALEEQAGIDLPDDVDEAKGLLDAFRGRKKDDSR